LQLIHNRLLLEAKRMLIFEDISHWLNAAVCLNWREQTFSSSLEQACDFKKG